MIMFAKQKIIYLYLYLFHSNNQMYIFYIQANVLLQAIAWTSRKFKFVCIPICVSSIKLNVIVINYSKYIEITFQTTKLHRLCHHKLMLQYDVTQHNPLNTNAIHISNAPRAPYGVVSFGSRIGIVIVTLQRPSPKQRRAVFLCSMYDVMGVCVCVLSDVIHLQFAIFDRRPPTSCHPESTPMTI